MAGKTEGPAMAEEEDPLDAELYADARGTDSQELLLSRFQFSAASPANTGLLPDDDDGEESSPPETGLAIVISSLPGTPNGSVLSEALELLVPQKHAEEMPEGAPEGENGGVSNGEISTSVERNVPSSSAIAGATEQLLPLKNENVGSSSLKRKLLAGDVADDPKSSGASKSKLSILLSEPTGNSSNTVHVHSEEVVLRSKNYVELTELGNSQMKEKKLGKICNKDAIHIAKDGSGNEDGHQVGRNECAIHVSKDVNGNEESHQVEHIGKKLKIPRFEESSHVNVECKLQNVKLLSHLSARVPSKGPAILPKQNDETLGTNSVRVCDELPTKAKGCTTMADKVLKVTDSHNSNCALHSVETEKLVDGLNKFKYKKTGIDRSHTFQGLVAKEIGPQIDGQMLPPKIAVSGTSINSVTLKEKQAGNDSSSMKTDPKKTAVSSIVFKNFSMALTNIIGLSKLRKSNSLDKERVYVEENASTNRVGAEHCKEPDFSSRGMEIWALKRKISAEDDVELPNSKRKSAARIAIKDTENGSLPRNDIIDNEAGRPDVVSNGKSTEPGGCGKKMEILSSTSNENAINGHKEVAASKGDADTGSPVKPSKFNSGLRKSGKVPLTFLQAVKALVKRPDQTTYDVDILDVARAKGLRFHYIDIESQSGISF